MSHKLAAAFVVTVSSLPGCKSDTQDVENPPPPKTVNIPAPASAAPSSTAATPEPTSTAAASTTASSALESAPDGSRITMSADGTCTYPKPYETNCPAGARCNPPAPKPVAVSCPDVPANARVEKLASGMCEATWRPACPEGVKCNPPPVRVMLPCDRAPSP